MRQVRTKWTPGSFLDKFNRASMILGYSNLPIAWGIASVPWDTMNDMDKFLGSLVSTKASAE
jgi:hypothetical protein